MSARNGATYKEGLKDSREVWLGDQRIDVTEHPAFKGSIDGMAAYFDYQHKYADDCLMTDSETGEQHNVSLLRPHNAEDIALRHRAFDRLARYSNGMLGRTPDYVNVVLAGHASRKDIFDRSGDPVYFERLEAYWKHVQKHDLALTHTIVHAAIDKSVGELQGINEELTLRVVERTDEGLIVRGAKMLATLGPIADELYVYPAVPIQKGYEEYALSFAIPVATQGVVSVCRDHYGVDQEVVDKPFSSRFDEQDAVIIFDDVLVPWDRVFIDGQLDVYNALNGGTATGNTQQQTAIRASVKLEFAYDLCTQMAKVTGTDSKPETATDARRNLLLPAHRPLGDPFRRSQRLRLGRRSLLLPRRHLRAAHDDAAMDGSRERHHQVHGLAQSARHPHRRAFDEPRLGPLLRKYLPGAGGVSPEERAKIFRTAWDFAGSALGSRNELYERFYLGSIGRARALDHKKAQAKGVGGAFDAMFAELGIYPVLTEAERSESGRRHPSRPRLEGPLHGNRNSAGGQACCSTRWGSPSRTWIR